MIKMKKRYILVLLAVLIIGAAGCVFTCCKKQKPLSTKVEDIVKNNETYLCNIVDSLNRIAISDSTNIIYSLRHFETVIELTGEVDTLETFGVVNVTNIYQIVGEDTVAYKTYNDVYIIYNDIKGNMNVELHKNTFWVGDCNMLGISKLISCHQAFNIVKSSTFDKPKSRFITIRQELGPKIANPQYIFGNDKRGLLFVDVVTGNVSTKLEGYEEDVNTPIVKDDSIDVDVKGDNAFSI